MKRASAISWCTIAAAAILVAGDGAAEQNTAAAVSVLLAPQDVFSRGATELATNLVLEQLRRSPGLVAVEPEEFFQSEFLQQARRSLQEVRRLVEEGFEFYQQLELENAVASLARAQQMLPQAVLVDEEESASLWHKTLSLLGAAYLLQGEQQAGQACFRQLLSIVPEARLDENFFPPRLVATFRAVAQNVQRAERAALELISLPANSRVYLDFRFACVTPCRLEGLAAGHHVVVARKSGYESTGRLVQLEGGDNRLQLRLLDLPGGEKLEKLVLNSLGGGALAEELVSLAQRAGLEKLVLGDLVRSGTKVIVRLSLWKRSAGRLSSYLAVEGPLRLEQWKDKLQQAVTELLQGKMNVIKWPDQPGGLTVPLAGEEMFRAAPTPFWKSWWFWSCVGAGAAAAVVLGVLLARPGEPAGTFVLQF